MKKFVLSFLALFLAVGVTPLHSQQDIEDDKNEVVEVVDEETRVDEEHDEVIEEDLIEEDSNDDIVVPEDVTEDVVEDVKEEVIQTPQRSQARGAIPDTFMLNEWDHTIDDANQRIILDFRRSAFNDVYIPGQYDLNGTTYNIVIKDSFVLKSNLTDIVIEEVNGVKVKILNPSATPLFGYNSKAKYVDARGLDISNFISLYEAFYNTYDLEYLDISNWDTRHIQNMSKMFANTALLDTSKLAVQTDSLVNGESMFASTKFSNLDFVDFNTGNLENASSMFARMASVTSLDLSNWDTKNLSNITNMFAGMTALVSLNVEGWDASKITSLSSTFSTVSALETIDLSSWGVVNIKDMAGAFANTHALKTLNLKHFNFKNTTSFERTFYRTRSLETIIVDDFSNQSANFMNSMFEESAYADIDLSKWTSQSIVRTHQMFKDAKNVKNLDLSNMNFSGVWTAEEMFQGASSLESIKFPEDSFKQVFSIDDAFNGTVKLEFIDLKTAEFSEVDDVADLFKTATPTKLLVVSDDDLIIGYDFAADNRVAVPYDGITVKAGQGTFGNGTSTQLINGKYNDFVTSYIALDKDGLSAALAALTPTSTDPSKAFVGWDIDLDTLTYPIDLRTTNLEITALYDNLYTVTFDIDGSTTTQSVVNGDTLDSSLVPVIPAKDGHTISGWSLDNQNVFNLTTPITSDITLKPLYERIQYKVSFKIDNQTTDINVGYDLLIDEDDIPEIPDKDGFNTLGWAVEGSSTLFDFNTPIKDDLVLVPLYDQIKHTVTFRTDQDLKVIVNDGETINANAIPALEDKDGFRTLGWAIEGSNVVFDFTNPIKDDLILVPLYEQIKHTVTFRIDTNDIHVVVNDNELIHEQDIPEVPNKAGYTFKGWSVDPSAKDVKLFDFNTPIKDDVVLTAVYVKDANPVDPVKPVEPTTPPTGISSNTMFFTLILIAGLSSMIVFRKRKA